MHRRRVLRGSQVLLKTVPFPDTHSFCSVNELRDIKAFDIKGPVSNMSSLQWPAMDGVCRAHSFYHLDLMAFFVFASLAFFPIYVSKRIALASKIQ